MRLEKLNGTDQRLYQFVAPLVMSTAVLRLNNNYPFKTSIHHVWFVALEDEQVVGFIPVEVRNKTAVINNYYAKGDDLQTLVFLLDQLIPCFVDQYKLQAVAHTRHLAVFQENGFFVIRTWKLYMKMEYQIKK